jgi:hypothetical protein
VLTRARKRRPSAKRKRSNAMIVLCMCLTLMSPDTEVTLGARQRMTFKASEIGWLEVASDMKSVLQVPRPEIQILLQSKPSPPIFSWYQTH